MELVWREDVRAAYRDVLNQLESVESIEGFVLGQNKSTQLPREYRKFITSYKAAYFKPETDAASKQMRWKRSKELQLIKGVTNAEIYLTLGLNPGNTNSYMKHGEVDKVSLENATAIMKYLFSY